MSTDQMEITDPGPLPGVPEIPPPAFDQWCIVELMGHVRMAGRVTEEERFGAKLGRVDVPRSDGTFSTHYFGGGSVYRLTPTTEALARSVAARNQPEPVHSWEMPKELAAPDSRDRREPFDEDAIDGEWDGES